MTKDTPPPAVTPPPQPHRLDPWLADFVDQRLRDFRRSEVDEQYRRDLREAAAYERYLSRFRAREG